MKKRYPLDVGTLPDEVKGEAIKPSSSRSDITCLIDAGLKPISSAKDRLFDPIGMPSWMYLSTIADKMRLALFDGMLRSLLSIVFTDLYFKKILKNINVDLIT